MRAREDHGSISPHRDNPACGNRRRAAGNADLRERFVRRSRTLCSDRSRAVARKMRVRFSRAITSVPEAPRPTGFGKTSAG